MTVNPLSRDPITTDLASPLQFQFILARAPSVSYQCQTVELPGVYFPPPEKNSPSLLVPYVGDHLIYEPIDLSFKIDQQFQNYLEIYNWMKSISDPSDTGTDYTTLENNPKWSPYQLYSDLSVIITTGQNIPILTCTLERAIPIRLSKPKMDSTISSAAQYNILSTCTIRYTKFRMTLP